MALTVSRKDIGEGWSWGTTGGREYLLLAVICGPTELGWVGKSWKIG